MTDYRKGKKRLPRGRRKQLIAALTGLLVIFMIFSLIFVDIAGFIIRSQENGSAVPDEQQDPVARLMNLLEDAEFYEEYIQEHGETQAVLERLAGLYQEIAYLVFGMGSSAEEKERLPDIPGVEYGQAGFFKYLNLEVGILKQLLEIDSRKPTYYMRIFDIYRELGKSEEDIGAFAERAIAAMKEILKENPNDNWTRYYYSLILKGIGDITGERQQLSLIFHNEEEGSELYSYAERRLKEIAEQLNEPSGDEPLPETNDPGNDELLPETNQ